MKRSKTEIEQLLAPFFDIMCGAITAAWARWIESEERQRWMFDRGRANYIFEHTAANAVDLFQDEPRVQIVRKDETLWFTVDRCVVFRFKKGDDAFKTRNVPTQQALAFHSEEPLFESLDRVDVVYLINDLGTEIKDVCVVARSENTVLWTIPLMNTASDNVVSLAPSPVGNGPDDPGRETVKPVKPKLFVVKGEGLDKRKETSEPS